MALYSTRIRPPSDPNAPLIPGMTAPRSPLTQPRDPYDPYAPTPPPSQADQDRLVPLPPDWVDPRGPGPHDPKVVPPGTPPPQPDPNDPRNANLYAPPPESDIFAKIRAAATSRGDDPNYWIQKWAEWGANDPDYFWMRMNQPAGPPEGSMPNLPSGIMPPYTLPAYPTSGGGPSPAANPNVDPFASMGGGVYMNGGWVPKDFPGAQEWLAAHPPGSGGSASGSYGIPTTPELNDAVRARLMKMLTPDPITGEMLMGTPEMASFRLASQRGQERNVAQLAEDASIGNFSDTPEFQAKRRGLGVARGEAEAKFMGDLAISRLQAQREDIVAAITAAQDQGQFEAKQALDLQLAQMDDAIKRMQISQDKYATDVQAGTTARGQDITRELGLGGLANDRYGIDVGAFTSRRGQDITKELGLTGFAIDWSRLAWDKEYKAQLIAKGLIPNDFHLP